MFNTQEFKTKIAKMAGGMKSSTRGILPAEIEVKIISELEAIFLKVSERMARSVPNVHGLKGKEAMQDLIERMERDFSLRLAKDVQHDLQRDVEIGKIKIAFLDSVRRALSSLEILNSGESNEVRQ